MAEISFHDLIQFLLSKYIDIPKQQEAKYIKHFEALTSVIVKELKKDKLLKNFIADLNLEGSSGDKLKIAKPDEYDLTIKLEIPYYKDIVVTRDSKMPGNVLLDMSRVLERLKDDTGADRQSTRNLLLSLVSENYLTVNRFQSWLQSHFSRALDRMSYRVEVDGVVSQLRYKTCGPAHTIFVKGAGIEYSVDYVAAIRLSAEQNVLDVEQLTYFRRANLLYWDAIPKPLKLTKDQVSFRSSFFKAENALLRGIDTKNCLNGIKLIKKFRDVKTNLGNLKSYYIKTLFLWKLRGESPHYWLRPLTVIMTEMFDELSECLRKGWLSFFWDPELNMLDVLTSDQVKEMYRCVQGFTDMLRRQGGSKSTRWTGGSAIAVLRAFSRKEERTPLRASQRIPKRRDVKRLQLKLKMDARPTGEANSTPSMGYSFARKMHLRKPLGNAQSRLNLCTYNKLPPKQI